MIDTDYERHINLYDFYILKGPPTYATCLYDMLDIFIKYEEFERCVNVKRWIDDQNQKNKIWQYTGE